MHAFIAEANIIGGSGGISIVQALYRQRWLWMLICGPTSLYTQVNFTDQEQTFVSGCRNIADCSWCVL